MYFSRDHKKSLPFRFRQFKKKEFDLYFHMLTNLKHDPLSEVQKRSGCYPKCKVVHYFYEVEKNILTWKTNYTSQVFIEPKSNVVEVASEYYEFDTNDLISSVGGNLGLFLGWSLLSISEKLGVLLTKFYFFCSHFLHCIVVKALTILKLCLIKDKG